MAVYGSLILWPSCTEYWQCRVSVYESHRFLNLIFRCVLLSISCTSPASRSVGHTFRFPKTTKIKKLCEFIKLCSGSGYTEDRYRYSEEWNDYIALVGELIRLFHRRQWWWWWWAYLEVLMCSRPSWEFWVRRPLQQAGGVSCVHTGERNHLMFWDWGAKPIPRPQFFICVKD